MPAVYTHYRFGKAVERSLPDALVDVLDRQKQAFALGTQGPDILFYHQPLKKNEIRSRGSALHALSPRAFFTRAAERIANEFDEKAAETLLAYACGFLCHFTLDAYCHPLIDGNTTEAFTHGKIESELDKYMLRKDGLPVRGYNTTTPIEDVGLVAKAASALLETEERAVRKAIKTIRKINGWFSCKRESFHALAHAVLKVVGMDKKFGDMFLHAEDDERFVGLGEALDEKFQAAIPAAGALIEEFYAAQKTDAPQLTNELFAYNYSGKIQEKKV